MLMATTSDGFTGFESSDHNRAMTAETADNRRLQHFCSLVRTSLNRRDGLPQLVWLRRLPDNSGPLAPQLSQSATERDKS
jgi:hypothetical protein